MIRATSRRVCLSMVLLAAAISIGCTGAPDQRLITVLVDASLSSCADRSGKRSSAAHEKRLDELARERQATWVSLVDQLRDGDSVTVYLVDDDQLQRRTLLAAFAVTSPTGLNALQASQHRARLFARLRATSIEPPACHGDSPLLAAVLLAATPGGDGRRPEHIVLISDLVEDSRVGGRRLRFDVQTPPPRDSIPAILSTLSSEARPLQGVTLHLMSTRDLRTSAQRLPSDRIMAMRQFWKDVGEVAGAKVVLGDSHVRLNEGVRSSRSLR